MINYKNFKNFIKINLLFKCFCVIACTYQTTMISQMYFSFKTTSNVKFETGKVQQLPGITICHPKFIQLKNPPVNITDATLNKIYNIPINNQDELFIESQKILINCKIKHKLNCNDVNKYICHFDQYYYCFTIFAQINGEDKHKYLVSEDSSDKRMIYIALLKYNNFVFISFHESSQPILSKNMKGYLQIGAKSAINYITYRKIVVKYLFNPSTKPCFEGQTHENCVTKCQINDFIENTGKHPPINLARYNYSLYFANFSEYANFQWTGRCDRLCGRFTECYKEYY